MDRTLVQHGILDAVPAQGSYLFFSVCGEGKLRKALKKLARYADGEAIVVGIGASLAKALNVDIQGLRNFSVLGGAVDVPSTPFALWCWLRGSDRGELLLRTRELEYLLDDAFQLELAIDAFKYDSGRDLTGYEDGTENPKGDAAVAAALVTKGKTGIKGSSFVAVQQWLHDLDHFESWPKKRQDNTIGRRREDNKELVKAPASAHVKRTAQEGFDPQAFVLRRSMPWSESDGSMGLVFVAFGSSFDAFEVQMRRMAGMDDAIVDALFGFSRPLTGSFFWCPPMQGRELDLSAVKL
ncbi:Dyp-type peroxidase [Georgfuchsia toluolica]|nr:Dyp-type peroxidase [Georgfuchsia toluolica]